MPLTTENLSLMLALLSLGIAAVSMVKYFSLRTQMMQMERNINDLAREIRSVGQGSVGVGNELSLLKRRFHGFLEKHGEESNVGANFTGYSSAEKLLQSGADEAASTCY